MKAIPVDRYPDNEREILEFLRSPHLRSDPKNHTVPLLDVFKLPVSGDTVLVMPLLRPFHNPRFQTVGEAVEFFRQIFEVRASHLCLVKSPLMHAAQAIQFMHEHDVAHG